jgi:hypothetical protein
MVARYERIPLTVVTAMAAHSGLHRSTNVVRAAPRRRPQEHVSGGSRLGSANVLSMWFAPRTAARTVAQQ